LPCPKDESTGEVVVNKTGMGSSAALVASMVGA
jgi:phosphomevalonate kinase